MKNFFNLVNGVLFVFLLVLCVSNILIGEMMYEFQREYRKGYNEYIEMQKQTLRHDSALDYKLNALLKGQINTHEIQGATLQLLDSNKKK